MKLSVYWDYAKSVGLCTTLFICLLYAGQNAVAIGANVWLSAWTNDVEEHGQQNNTSVRLGVYATLGILQGEHIGVFIPSYSPPTYIPLSQNLQNSTWPFPVSLFLCPGFLPWGE